MARRGNNNKPHLLSEATVKKFMKLSGLENHSNNFRKDMGYNNNTRDQYWEQPGLSQYRSRLHEEMEGNVSQDPDKAIGPGAQDQLSEEEEMGMDMGAPEDDAAPAGDVEAKVEDIVTAIADAIEQAVPEVSVDVEAGGDAAPADDAAPAEEPAMDAAPAPADDEAGMADLQETIRGAIREAFRMREEMEGNVSQDPDKAIGPGAQDQLSEEEEAEGNGGDAPEVEAVVDAIVDAIESATDMEVQAEPAEEGGEAEADDEEAAMKGRKMEAMDKKDGEDEEAAAMKKMMEALKNRKTAKRLVENVMRRARAQAKRSGRSRR